MAESDLVFILRENYPVLDAIAPGATVWLELEGTFESDDRVRRASGTKYAYRINATSVRVKIGGSFTTTLTTSAPTTLGPTTPLTTAPPPTTSATSAAPTTV